MASYVNVEKKYKLSRQEQTKAIRIDGQVPAEAEAWLFDPTHEAENVGMMDLSDTISVLAQSVLSLAEK